MASLLIRDLPEPTAAYYRRRAEKEGRSLAEHIRARLISEATLGRLAFLQVLDAFHARMREVYGITGSPIGIVADIRRLRADREVRMHRRRRVA